MKSILGLISVCLLLTMLSGCTSTKDKIPIISYQQKELPVLPDRYSKNIPDPGVRAGRSSYVELATNRAWGKTQAEQHRNFVLWYKRLQEASATPVK